jgi:cytochrome c5
MSRRTAFQVCLVLASAAVALGAGTAQMEKGEQIQNVSCANCHDLRPIQTQALDHDGWTGVVDAMIDRGADIRKEDIPVLVDYLVANYGPLPDGAGKRILLNNCTLCHDLSRVKRRLSTREEWEELLSAMLNEGAMLSDQEFPVLLNYLATHFKSD